MWPLLIYKNVDSKIKQIILNGPNYTKTSAFRGCKLERRRWGIERRKTIKCLQKPTHSLFTCKSSCFWSRHKWRQNDKNIWKFTQFDCSSKQMEVFHNFVCTLDCNIAVLWYSYFVLLVVIYETQYAIQKWSSKDVAIKER